MGYKLTKKQAKEPMFITWGRIRAVAGQSSYGKAPFNPERLEELIEKFNRDLANAKVEEGHFNDKK